ncbi:MAG: ATP-binding cassette domain-containing protein [bacterium]|nr:ATP-binding cassette domain-containing protein [bacterium]
MTIVENYFFELRNLTKNFGLTKVLNKIFLSFIEGDRVLIVGPNGSGKSTLIKILLGLLSKSSGEIMLEGKEVNRPPLFESSFLGHNSLLYAPLSVLENLKLLLRLRDGSEELNLILEEWSLLTQKNKLISELSKGNEWRAALAVVLNRTASFLYLDEPTTSLDQSGRELFLGNFNKIALNKKLTVIATHDVRGLAETINRVVVLKHGQVSKDIRGNFKEAQLSSLYLEACS